MSDSVLIFTEQTSPRLAYVSRLIFDMRLGVKALITIDYEEFLHYTGPKILYRTQSGQDSLHIAPADLLFDDTIQKQAITTCKYGGFDVPFATGSKDFPFDVFAAVFYLVSRYEEYLPGEKNEYEQFKATDSLAFTSGFLEKPVVDIWINDIQTALLQLYPALNCTQSKARYIFTYDIDVAYAYLGRSVFTTLANLVYESVTFKIKKLKERLQVLFKIQKDPFDTYAHILAKKSLYAYEVIFFFLLGKKNKYNHNVQPDQSVLRKLIIRLSKTEIIGIHPSYYAHTNCKLMEAEKEILEDISRKKINHSRQHYLRLSLPVTYSNLIEAGIIDDYTLGFAELPGFRAGTCHPFYFYNLQTETETDLKLHPVTFMEGTFIDDMKLTPDETLIKMKQLMDEVKKVNGEFICIWHNHTLSDQDQWKGMRNVHDNIAAYTKQ
jgi:hypothetical protein